MGKKPAAPAGIEKFVSLMGGLINVPKKQLDAQIKKYEVRKAPKKAKAAKKPPRPSR